jgi:hypothetical protein
LKFLDFLNGWVRLTNVLNELSRSMGQPDYYPFVLPRAAVGKLQFIHQVITEQRQRSQTGAAQSPGTSTDVALDAAASSTVPATVPAPAPAVEAGGTVQSQSQSQAQTQTQQPFFQTGLQQNQGMFDHRVGDRQSH